MTSLFSHLLSISLLISVLVLLPSVFADACRCTPEDDCWPSPTDWEALNATVQGRLIVTVPLASPCHEPNYDAYACNQLKEQWLTPTLHDEDPASIMAAAPANETCDPFTPKDSPCTLGNQPAYVVNATGPEDFAVAVKFANDHNIRLIIRNTGHDYFGKSSGAKALSVWTHHLKDITFLDNYDSPNYQGSAVRVLAGIQVIEVYEAAEAHNVTIVGGDCPTVGVAGGYTQGGGTSSLSSTFGMGADQTLEWEVVDGTGRLIKASLEENPDLYWALSGGGGGSYGVVYSLTVKAHKPVQVAGVNLNFTTSANISQDLYYQAIEEYFRQVPVFTAAGGAAIALVQPQVFTLTPLILPNHTPDQARELLAPLRKRLDDLGILYNFSIVHYDSWLPFYENTIEGSEFRQKIHNAQYGGWFMPLDVVQSKPSDIASVFRDILKDGVIIRTLGLNVSQTPAWNAVNPAWREVSMHVVLYTPWPEGADLTQMASQAERMTNEWVPTLSSIAPGAGAYMSEANPNQPDWQEAFYGSNYDQLLKVKQQYDPNELFSAWTAVGSDRWYENANGALCRIDT